MGVVFLPSRVTGFSAMSRRQMMMFIEERERRENSSQWAGWPGADWRLILRWTCFSGIESSVKSNQSTVQRKQQNRVLRWDPSSRTPQDDDPSSGRHFAASYLRTRGGISEMSTGS